MRSSAERAVELRLGKICRRLLQDLVGGSQLLDLALQLLDPSLVGAAPARPLPGVTLRLDTPFAKREAGASELLGGRGVGRAAAGSVGTIFLEQPNSASAEFGWLPRGALSTRHEISPSSLRLVRLADCSPENPGRFTIPYGCVS